ncbi:unnamed protein product [Ceratitis capitata]|uniref:(Mediterranean fruit fly) hypothetical protein n=1 Tax=Ceratitis capitata TaxID=7213 RepID=A0A811U817_CERCA|nr:unnamed protein product [Ceratitis capitata]
MIPNRQPSERQRTLLTAQLMRPPSSEFSYELVPSILARSRSTSSSYMKALLVALPDLLCADHAKMIKTSLRSHTSSEAPNESRMRLANAATKL